ncbi:MAG TPA: hypothetical protein VFX53_17175 [Pedococcus sp.]|nr:hypothetical protein [Pedococcus sp.]
MTDCPLGPEDLEPVELVEVDDPGPEPPEDICEHGEVIDGS